MPGAAIRPVARRAEPIRQPGRLRQPVTAQGALHPGQRGIGTDPMAAGHEQRLAAHLAAQHPAQLFIALQQRRMCTGLGARLDEPAHQLRLGHADARQVGDHAQMRGHAQPARMADAVAIDEHQIRRLRQQRQCRQQRRQLAETEQAGDVGHHRRNPRDLLRHGLQRLRIQQHRRGAGDGAVVFKADIQPGQPAHVAGQAVLALHAAGKLDLLRAGSGDAAFPASGVDHRIHWPQHRMRGATAR